MPLHDGTGPWNSTPRAGRGKGARCSGFGYRSISWPVFHGKQNWLPGIIVPLVATLLRDLLNPSGVFRQILQATLHKRIADDGQKIVRETECIVMSTQSAPVMPKRKTYQ